jgi:ABC-type polysaccharide/polyol phosphate export permease
VSSASQIWSYRFLIGNLTQRELKSRYKRSLLGWGWSLINPAATLLIYALVFGSFLRIVPPVAGNGHLQSFALYLFAGLVVWNFFNNVMTGSMGSLLGVGSLLRKVYFPPESPAIANALAVVTQTIVEATILVVVMAVVGNASWTFVFVPWILGFVLLFALGLGLVLSLLNVYFRDIGYLTAILLNLLFYATPIIYTFDLVPQKVGFLPVRTIITLNPLTQFVGGMRDAVYLLQVPSLGRIVGIVVSSLVTFFAGWAIFSRHSRLISEEL